MALGQMTSNDWAETPVAKKSKSVDKACKNLSESQFSEAQMLMTRHNIHIEPSFLDYIVDSTADEICMLLETVPSGTPESKQRFATEFCELIQNPFTRIDRKKRK